MALNPRHLQRRLPWWEREQRQDEAALGIRLCESLQRLRGTPSGPARGSSEAGCGALCSLACAPALHTFLPRKGGERRLETSPLPAPAPRTPPEPFWILFH